MISVRTSHISIPCLYVLRDETVAVMAGVVFTPQYLVILQNVISKDNAAGPEDGRWCMAVALGGDSSGKIV